MPARSSIPLSQRVDIGSGKLVICQPVHSAAGADCRAGIQAAAAACASWPGLPGALQRLADLNRQIEALR